jgi:hypothetical protein
LNYANTIFVVITYGFKFSFICTIRLNNDYFSIDYCFLFAFGMKQSRSFFFKLLDESSYDLSNDYGKFIISAAKKIFSAPQHELNGRLLILWWPMTHKIFI